jgi:hypothetical protein
MNTIDRPRAVLHLALVAILAGGVSASGQAPAPRASPEAATARRFLSVRRQPPRLLAFLAEMPKGGDLHNHLSGAIYAESYLRWAIEDKLCLAIPALSIVAPPCDPAAGRPPAATALRDTATFNQAIDAMSMRNADPDRNGHDRFFAAFAKFGPAAARIGDMLAEVAHRAADEQVSYLELMLTPDGGVAAQRGRAAGWDLNLAALRNTLLATGFRDAVVNEARQRLDRAEARLRDVLACGSAKPDIGCTVTLRYISQVARAGPPEAVFAQMLSGFELARADPRIVGLNLVQPEDDPTAVKDFTLHMSMLDYLHRLYPEVRITLHAGELTDGLVPPEALRFHIRQSIDLGHARRIGHGVAIMFEQDAPGLLREMAAKRILVEIALTSNDVILGVRGARHPLMTYLEYGVPVALVTDDAGVSRSSLTLEFRKAVEEHDLDYLALKRMVRHSLEHAFVAGSSLWADAKAFRAIDACRPPGGIEGTACQSVAAGSAKARLQRDLELALARFERRQATEK